MSAYCTPEQVSAFSQIAWDQLGFAGTANFAAFTSGTLIPMAQQIVDSYVDHNFLSNLGTVTLDGNGKRILMMPPPYLPMINAGTVKIGGAAVSGIKTYQTYLAYESGTFSEDSASRQNVEATVEYGYGAVPSDVQYVAAQVAANILADMLRRKLMPDTVARAMQSNSDTVVITGMAKNANVLTSELRMILDKYRFSRMDVT